MAYTKEQAAAYAREWRAKHRAHLRTYRQTRYAARADAERQRALDRYYANHDVIRQQRKARYAAKPKRTIERTPEEKAAHREYMRQWSRDHRATLTAKRRTRYRANPEPHRTRDQQRYAKKYQTWLAWTRRNPMKIAEYNALRRARTAAVPSDKKISGEAIYARDGGICGICHEPVSREQFSLDHITPLARGGPHVESNLQTAHRTCNSRKGANLATRAA